MSDDLRAYAEQLHAAAARLREEDLPEEEAAALVEECARLATEAGAELDRTSRNAANR